jgi:hypothetical protein
MHIREDVLVCACRGARVLCATVEVIAVLVNSNVIARACVVFELEQVRDGAVPAVGSSQISGPESLSPC